MNRALLSILEEYHGLRSLENVPISVDILRKIVKKRCDLTTLQRRSLDVETEYLMGNVKFYYPVPKSIRTNEAPTTAIISYSNRLNFCWTRFVICKELCHCLIDMDENRVKNIEELSKLIEGLSTGSISPDRPADAPFDRPLLSEQWAEVLALEILYPFELRRAFAADLKEKRITNDQLAQRFRIPVEYAARGMLENYLASIERWRKDLLVRI